MSGLSLILIWLAIPTLFLSGVIVACGDDDDDDAISDDDDDEAGDTWTDSSSGLTWRVRQNGGYMAWGDAKADCDTLSFDNGGWRLPTISELRTLVRGCDSTVTGGSCGVTDDCLDSSCRDSSCNFCEYGDGPNNDIYGPAELPDVCGMCEMPHWSSSLVEGGDNSVWVVNFSTGNVYSSSSDSLNDALCVR